MNEQLGPSQQQIFEKYKSDTKISLLPLATVNELVDEFGVGLKPVLTLDKLLSTSIVPQFDRLIYPELARIYNEVAQDGLKSRALTDLGRLAGHLDVFFIMDQQTAREITGAINRARVGGLIEWKDKRGLLDEKKEVTNAGKNRLREENAFCRILAINTMPETVQDLPTNFYLPVEAMGDMETLLFQTLDDGRERAQAIGINNRMNFRKSFHLKGNNYSVGVPPKNFISRAIFGDETLISHHTHPDTVNDGPMYIASSKDIVFCMRQPYFIVNIEASDGVAALVKTKQATRKGSMNDQMYRMIWEGLQYRKFEQVNIHRQSSMAAELGLGYYIWVPPYHRVLKGDYNNGITLEKVKQG